MIDAQDTDLRSLLDDVCEHATTDSFARSWGVVEESRTRPGGWLIHCSSDRSFAHLDVSRWDTDGIGLVDVGLRERERWSFARFRELFGPLEEMTASPDDFGGRRVAGDWRSSATAAADALLIVTVDDDDEFIIGITIRRDPRKR